MPWRRALPHALPHEGGFQSVRTGSGLDRKALGPLAERGVALLAAVKRPPIVTGGPCGCSEGKGRRAWKPSATACYARLRDDTRQAEGRLQVEDDLHATAHVRDTNAYIYIDAACCNAAACARYAYIYIHGFRVPQRVGASGCSAPTAWHRCAPTSNRRGSRRARPGRPSCSTSTCAQS
jgi:hypothetical protein